MSALPFAAPRYSPQSMLGMSSRFWQALPSERQVQFNALCLKMQQAGLLPPGPRVSGYSVYVQLTRAMFPVYGMNIWTEGDIPGIPTLPLSLPKFTITATDTGLFTSVHLDAPAYAGGCQIAMSRLFIPGCCDPFKKPTRIVGGLPEGWPEGGVSLQSIVGEMFHPTKSAAFVVKLVPVTRDGFVGPSLSEVCIVE